MSLRSWGYWRNDVEKMSGELMLAVDPSINNCGVAVFKGEELVNSYVVTHAPYTGVCQRAGVLASSVIATQARHLLPCQGGGIPSVVVLEWPQVYTHGDNDRNDLLGLAAVCGALTYAAMQDEIPVATYLPAEWCHQLKKSKKGDPKKSPRGLYIGRRLEGKELDVWASVKSHDAVDAIGIGLHHLGRMERKRVFPGAS